LNLTRPALGYRPLREALNLAVPVDDIVAKVFRGYARVPDSPLAFATSLYSSIGQLTPDPARAVEMLAAAGFWPQAPLRLAMLASDGLFPFDTEIAAMVAAGLRQVGVVVTVTSLKGNAYWNEVRRAQANMRWDLALLNFDPVSASGQHQLNAQFRANVDDAAVPDAWNVGRYRNKQVDQLLDEAERTASASRSQAALTTAQELIWHDAPMLWLPIADHIVAMREAVTGVEISPAGFTLLRHAG
jgi:ABC-type transport system substrate-binding protein